MNLNKTKNISLKTLLECQPDYFGYIHHQILVLCSPVFLRHYGNRVVMLHNWHISDANYVTFYEISCSMSDF